MRIKKHPILKKISPRKTVKIQLDGQILEAFEGEPIAAALVANGIKTFRFTKKKGEPRGIYCAIGRCTDCIMTVNRTPNVRTCVTAVEDGMVIETQGRRGSNCERI